MVTSVITQGIMPTDLTIIRIHGRPVGQNWLPLPIPWSLSKIKNKKRIV